MQEEHLTCGDRHVHRKVVSAAVSGRECRHSGWPELIANVPGDGERLAKRPLSDVAALSVCVATIAGICPAQPRPRSHRDFSFPCYINPDTHGSPAGAGGAAVGIDHGGACGGFGSPARCRCRAVSAPAGLSSATSCTCIHTAAAGPRSCRQTVSWRLWHRQPGIAASARGRCRTSPAAVSSRKSPDRRPRLRCVRLVVCPRPRARTRR